MEARKLAESIKAAETIDIIDTCTTEDDAFRIVQSLDALGYDEAAHHVYGMTYGDWKKRYVKKASEGQMERYNGSQHIWASHDEKVLAKRAGDPGKIRIGGTVNPKKPALPQLPSSGAGTSLLSNVCCQDLDDAKTTPHASTAESEMGVNATKTTTSRQLPPYQPPAPPSISFSLGVLTVSDRASSGEYPTGDLSGPAVQRALEAAVGAYGSGVTITATEVCIVPDERDSIESKLREWADSSKIDLILTTGGTGFAPRDVTPEATNSVVDKNCEGLLAFSMMECAKLQPLASLSRGTAGIRRKTFIANLPGNPKGVVEVIPILLPLALHVVADIKAVQPMETS